MGDWEDYVEDREAEHREARRYGDQDAKGCLRIFLAFFVAPMIALVGFRIVMGHWPL